MYGRLSAALFLVLALAAGGYQPLEARETPDVRVGLEQDISRATLKGGPFRLEDVDDGETLVEETPEATLEIAREGDYLKLPREVWEKAGGENNAAANDDDAENGDKKEEPREPQVKRLQIKPAKAGGRVEFQGTPYRGVFEIQVRDGALTVINELPLEEYLYGVVPREMPASFPGEALKAQAVAARTYTLRNLGRHGESGFDLCASVHCQVYGGAREHEATNKAVDATAGEVLRYQGELAHTYYHACSGGHTEDSGLVWGSSFPYLRGVEDRLGDSPYRSWTLEVDGEELTHALQEHGLDVGRIKDLRVTQRSDSGRAYRLQVEGERGNAEFSGEQLRSWLGYGELRSTRFDVEVSTRTVEGPWPLAVGPADEVWVLGEDGIPVRRKMSELSVLKGAEREQWFLWRDESEPRETLQKAVFKGSGSGHGVGMSQWGAKALAEEAKPGEDTAYRDILQHYYQGTQIEPY